MHYFYTAIFYDEDANCFLKLGTTNNVVRRIKEHIKAFDGKLNYVDCVPLANKYLAKQFEKSVLTLMHPYKVGGKQEWFTHSDPDVLFQAHDRILKAMSYILPIKSNVRFENGEWVNYVSNWFQAYDTKYPIENPNVESIKT